MGGFLFHRSLLGKFPVVSGKHRRRRRKRRDLRLERAVRLGQEASANLVVNLAQELASPRPDEDMLGDQTHFLRRIDRLPEEAQRTAIELYYAHGLRRFTARLALDLTPEKIGFEEDPDDLASRRVVVEIEPGAFPSRVILDGRGKVITCLAPDMAVGSGRIVSYPMFRQLVDEFDEWRESQQAAAERARSCDLFGLCRSFVRTGWLTPQEKVIEVLSLGPAGSHLLLSELDTAIASLVRDYSSAVLSGARDDSYLRRWFRQTGAVAVFLSVLAELRVAPDLEKYRMLFQVQELVIPMVMGACLVFWKPRDAEDYLAPETDEERSTLASRHCALMIYFGIIRRLLQAHGTSPEAQARVDTFIDRTFDSWDRESRQRHVLGLGDRPIADFVRDLASLAQGRRPDWGDDLVGDPDELPPLLLDDLCMPAGDEPSFSALRYLAQRLFHIWDRPFYTIFSSADQLDHWRSVLGPLDRTRRGVYRLPWVLPEQVPTPRSRLPGRNEPCFCGSGKKFKRCCLPKLDKPR